LERTLSEGPHAYRIKALVEDLDRAHFMGLALQKIPVSMPVRGKFRYSSNYGLRKDPFTRKVSRHEGVDMVARSGTAIYATADGEVVYAGWKGGFGRVVRIRHIHGFETVYGHLRKIHVRPGQMVSRGDRIGDMGNSGRSTGTHLHYEVHVGGNPRDPKKYLEAGRNVF
jgi:murein DD-endopeptidase MepM/ murein hydrolase activator NlpD